MARRHPSGRVEVSCPDMRFSGSYLSAEELLPLLVARGRAAKAPLSPRRLSPPVTLSLAHAPVLFGFSLKSECFFFSSSLS